MRVGILTFHDGINYGAFFQVYALQSFLLRHGFQCQVINYKNLGFTIREYKCFLNFLRLSPKRIIRNIIKIRKFKIAHQKLHLTKRFFRSHKLARIYFDTIIIGSDEVWNCRSSFIGYDPTYFSQGLKAGRIIAYAASFGSIETPEVIPELLISLFNKMDYISVRDENSANIIHAINKRAIQVVLDPTFLVDFKPEMEIPDDRGFILVYGFFSKRMARQISDYARFLGKKTISIGYNRPWCNENLDTLSPFQWLGYFVNCDRVITTMFHGMIFSLLNQKEFCMFRTPYRKNKIGNFLSDLALPGRIIDENESIESAFAEQIDYLKVNEQIKNWRSQSEEFLLSALESRS